MGISDFCDKQPNPTLENFLERVSLVADVDEWDDTGNAVTLMTLHSAKGLEFPVVFISGLEEGLLPIRRAIDEPQALEEERRLFYVGITRAKEKVYFSYAHQRMISGETERALRSRFLDEIPSDLLETYELQPPTYQEGWTRPRRRPLRKPPKSPRGALPFEVGSLVGHELFGRGRVIQLEGTGDKLKLSVEFDGHGLKKLMASYANLTIIQPQDLPSAEESSGSTES